MCNDETLHDLRQDAHRVLKAALRAVDPYAAVRRALRIERDVLYVGGSEIPLDSIQRTFLVGAGKASTAMARGVMDVLRERLTAGTITTKEGQGERIPGISVYEAAHPVPDERGRRGAHASLELARTADSNDLVIFVLSGGGSALWPATVEGVSLADLQQITDQLQRAGARIQELNTVRKHLSSISGGQLLRAASPARMVTLVLSDVVGSDLSVIASGPTVPDPTTFHDALDILYHFHIDAPTSVWEHLREGVDGRLPETPKPGDRIFASQIIDIVGQNRDALEAARDTSEKLGYSTLPLTTRMEGEAREIARLLAGLAINVRKEGLPLAPPAALLLGGETTVTVRGNGRGGRNQEMALAAAIALDSIQGAVIACLGTDGTDGPTDAAGGLVDGTTVSEATDKGLDTEDFLERNDAYTLLKATGDLLITGPTGTNVNDLALILVR